MSLSTRSRPSPAMIVAVVALSFALVGSAVAGTDAIDRAINKSKVKTIAKKQASKQIDEKAPGLSVANAVTAQNATNATNATTAANGAAGYGEFTQTGTVRAGALNMNNLTVGTQPFVYCEDQAFKAVTITGGFAAPNEIASAAAISRQQITDAGITPQDVGCPANTEWIYTTWDATGTGAGTRIPAAFQVQAQ